MESFDKLKLSLTNSCTKLNGKIAFDVIGSIIPLVNFNNQIIKNENKITEKYGEIVKSKTDGKIRKTYLTKNMKEKCLKNSSIFKIGMGENELCKSIILQISSIIISGLTVNETRKLINTFIDKIRELQSLIFKMKEIELEKYLEYISKFKMVTFDNKKLETIINKNYNSIDTNLNPEVCKYLLNIKNEFYNYLEFHNFVIKFYNLDCLYIFNNDEPINTITITMYSYLIKLGRKIIKPYFVSLIHDHDFIIIFDPNLPYVKLINYFYKKDDELLEFEYLNKNQLIQLKTIDDKIFTVKQIENSKKNKEMEIYKTTFLIYATGTIKFTGTNIDVMRTKYEYLSEIINENINSICI